MNLLAHSSYLNHYNPYIVSMELLPTCLSAITLVEILYTVCYTLLFSECIVRLQKTLIACLLVTALFMEGTNIK